MSVALTLKNLRTDLRTKPLNDAPAESRENDQQYPQAQRKGQSHILLAFGSLMFTSAILNETRGKIIRPAKMITKGNFLFSN